MWAKDFPTATEHEYPDQLNDDLLYECAICGHTVKIKRGGACVGVPVYHQWDDIPDTMATKTTLSKEHGLKLAKGQAIVGAKYRYDRKGKHAGFYPLYAIADAIPKKKPTQAQLEALEKARQASAEQWKCERCGTKKENRNGKYCEWCRHELFLENRKQEAIEWSKGHLANGFVILDSETTGLGWSDELVQLAVIDHQGKVLLDTYLKPDVPERLLFTEDGISSSDIHGITPDMVAEAPTFAEIYTQLAEVISGKYVLIYNADFDTAFLDRSCERNNLELIEAKYQCVMNWYAQFYGDWSDYHKSFRWQSLYGGDHTALGDCKATLALIKEMAKTEVTVASMTFSELGVNDE